MDVEMMRANCEDEEVFSEVNICRCHSNRSVVRSAYSQGQFYKRSWVISFTVLLYVTCVSSQEQTEPIKCGLSWCERPGYVTCIEVEDDAHCYDCHYFNDTCGTEEQRKGCHLYCKDLLQRPHLEKVKHLEQEKISLEKDIRAQRNLVKPEVNGEVKDYLIIGLGVVIFIILTLVFIWCKRGAIKERCIRIKGRAKPNEDVEAAEHLCQSSENTRASKDKLDVSTDTTDVSTYTPGVSTDTPGVSIDTPVVSTTTTSIQKSVLERKTSFPVQVEQQDTPTILSNHAKSLPTIPNSNTSESGPSNILASQSSPNFTT